jgi:hypothetical protein
MRISGRRSTWFCFRTTIQASRHLHVSHPAHRRSPRISNLSHVLTSLFFVSVTDYGAGGSNTDEEVVVQGELEDYATFLRREMPTLVRRELETMMTEEFPDVEEKMRPRVAQIVMSLQPRLLDLYRRSSSDSEPSEEASSTRDVTNSTPSTVSPPSNAFPVSAQGEFSSPEVNYDEFSWQNYQPQLIEDPAAAGPSGHPSMGPDFGHFNWDLTFDGLLDQTLFTGSNANMFMATNNQGGVVSTQHQQQQY